MHDARDLVRFKGVYRYKGRAFGRKMRWRKELGGTSGERRHGIPAQDRQDRIKSEGEEVIS